MSENTNIPERSEYKGNALLVLNPQDPPFRRFSFGVSKAKLILEHIDAIRDFVADETGEVFDVD